MAYDKSFNITSAAALLNIELTTNTGGWVDITDYKGNTIRFHFERSCPNGGTEYGVSVPNTFTDYKDDPYAWGGTPSDIIFVDPDINTSGTTAEWGTHIARAINDDNTGFGQHGGSIIALGYDDGSGTPHMGLPNYNFNKEIHDFNCVRLNLINIVTHFEHGSTTQPSGDGFTNSAVNSGVNARVKVLLIQNNPGKVNNTHTTNNLDSNHYFDGNVPIYYGQGTNGDLLFTGENPTAFVGGECEMIKAHYPLNSTSGQYNTESTFDPLNTVVMDGDGNNIPLATLPNDHESLSPRHFYSDPDTNHVPQETTINSGGTWVADKPGA